MGGDYLIASAVALIWFLRIVHLLRSAVHLTSYLLSCEMIHWLTLKSMHKTQDLLTLLGVVAF